MNNIISLLDETKNEFLGRVCSGKPINELPKIKENGFISLTSKEIVQQRVRAWNSHQYNLAEYLAKNHFIGGDSFMYYPDGCVKIVINSKTLRDVDSETNLDINGAQILPNGTFDNTNGYKFTREEINKYGNKYLNKKEVKENPFWLALVQEDRALLNEYAEHIFLKGNLEDAMSFYIGVNTNLDSELETPFFIHGAYTFNIDYDSCALNYGDSLEGDELKNYAKEDIKIIVTNPNRQYLKEL